MQAPWDTFQTVINNVLINNIELPRPIHSRVMLTTLLYTFSVRKTTVVYRGLLDVGRDEASLAMVLCHEVGRIVLGRKLGS
ncbi:MAG: hypothetical protein JOZ36_15880 [Acidobacteria bacterium]|nr:hypothetical protein [Acidobacteriota bacterium]